MTPLTVVLLHASRPKHSCDVVCKVSGVAPTSDPGTSLNTAPLRSLALPDHSARDAPVCLSLLYFGQITMMRQHTNRQHCMSYKALQHSCTDNLACAQCSKTAILLWMLFGVVLLLHLGMCAHIMMNWKPAWSIQCISAVMTEAWGRSKSSW